MEPSKRWLRSWSVDSVDANWIEDAAAAQSGQRRRETTTRSDQERSGGSRHREGEASWRLFCVRCRWRQERGLDLHDIDLHLLEINPAGSASRNETFSKASKATSDHRGLLGIARDY